jgi:hypothetical protein
MHREGFQLGAEDETLPAAGSLPTIVQGLLTEAITPQYKRLFLAVPDCEGEHADTALDRLPHAPHGKSGQQGLRVRVPTPTCPLRTLTKIGLQLCPKIKMVVDLAVVRDDEAARMTGHRLAPGWRKIKDR